MTILAIAALALSLGMSITAFSIINELFFKSPPFKDADELYDIGLVNTEAGKERWPIPLEHYDDLRQLNCFTESFGYFPGTINISGKGLPVRYDGSFVTREFPGVLGIEPVLGKPFSDKPFAGEQPGELMISYAAWQRQFRGIPT